MPSLQIFGRRIALAVVTGVLVACADPAPLRPMPAGPINVVEVQHANLCGTQGEAPQISLFRDLSELQTWQTARNVDLSGSPLRQGPYALIELGERATGGYGIVVSRRGKLRDGVIRLTATFLMPPAGQPATQMVNSPCVLIALPKVDISRLILLDQSGKERARSSRVAIVAPSVIPKTLPDIPPAPVDAEPVIPAAPAPVPNAVPDSAAAPPPS